MTAKGIFLALVILLFGLFALLNWETITLPRPVNLVVAQPSLPLGLILIAVIVGLSIIDFLLSSLARARWLKEASGYEKRLHYLRDALERSQFEELAGVEKRLTDRLGALERRVVGMSAEVDESLRKTQHHVDERILGVRNDLAEDIARLHALIRSAPIHSAPGASTDASTTDASSDNRSGNQLKVDVPKL